MNTYTVGLTLARAVLPLCESHYFWYFSTMPPRRRKQFPPRTSPVVRVDFDRAKYGTEILVDCAWVREMPTFLRPYPHALHFYDILLVTRGRGWHWLDGRRDAVRPGQVYFVSPGEVRNWNVRGLEGLCLFFPAQFLDAFFNDSLFLHRLPYFHVPRGGRVLSLTPAQARQLRKRLLAVRHELQHLRADSTHLMRAQLYEILITLARQYSTAHGPAQPRSPNHAAIRFRELVEQEATRRRLVSSYARQMGISPNHLNAICKKHLGRPAKTIILERLAAEARRLLLYSDESAERIGYALGFPEPSYFTKFVRRTTGRTPSSFRKSSAAL